MRINRRLIRGILTALGIIGVPLTSWLSIKCSEKAAKVEDPKEKFKCYLPAIISGVLTMGCTGASFVSADKEILMLSATAAYAVSNKDKLKEEMKKYLPREEIKQIETKAAAKSVPQGTKYEEPERTRYGNTLFLDGWSGRRFYSSLDRVDGAIKRISRYLNAGDYICVNDFYRELGLQLTDFGDRFGWVPDDKLFPRWFKEDNPLGFEYASVDDENGNPMILIICAEEPIDNWREA